MAKGQNRQNRRRNIALAITYIIVGIVGVFSTIGMMMLMWFSGTFLPVYIDGNYVIGNQIVRYALYILLIAATIAFAKCENYGSSYLFKRRKKR